MSEFAIKDSGARQSFKSGMVRDTTEGKINFLSVRFGPMFRRWADHLTKGRQKYPDVQPGVPNWTLASGIEEFLRAKESAARHFEAWLNGERDEDHAAGVFFNINVAEYVLEQLDIDPGTGVLAQPAKPDPVKDVLEYEPLDPFQYAGRWHDHHTDYRVSGCPACFPEKFYSVKAAEPVTQPRVTQRCVSCECPNPHCHTGLNAEFIG